MTPRANQSLRVHWLLLILAVTLCALVTVLGNHQIAHAEPSTIRVWRAELQRVDVVDFQAYLRVVLPEEWVADWQDQDGTPESLRAGAVAVRTFGWYYVLHPQCPSVNPPNCPAVYDLTDTSQTYDPLDPSANHPNTNQAIGDTAGQHITYNGATLWARYGQHNGDPTVAYAGYDPPLSSVNDPIDADETRTGHGNGVCQYGSRHWARGRSANGIDFPQWGYQRILVQYYTGIHIRDASGSTLTPSYRWNPLHIDWGTPDNHPPIMYHGGSYPVTVQVQNTSIYDWPIDGQSWALSYHWAKAGFGEILSDNRAWTTVDVPKGDPPYTFSLLIDDILNWGSGDYTLKFDMVLLTYGGTYWFSSTYDWPTYDVKVCVDCGAFLPLVVKN